MHQCMPFAIFIPPARFLCFLVFRLPLFVCLFVSSVLIFACVFYAFYFCFASFSVLFVVYLFLFCFLVSLVAEYVYLSYCSRLCSPPFAYRASLQSAKIWAFFFGFPFLLPCRNLSFFLSLPFFLFLFDVEVFFSCCLFLRGSMWSSRFMWRLVQCNACT